MPHSDQKYIVSINEYLFQYQFLLLHKYWLNPSQGRDKLQHNHPPSQKGISASKLVLQTPPGLELHEIVGLMPLCSQLHSLRGHPKSAESKETVTEDICTYVLQILTSFTNTCTDVKLNTIHL